MFKTLKVGLIAILSVLLLFFIVMPVHAAQDNTIEEEPTDNAMGLGMILLELKERMIETEEKPEPINEIPLMNQRDYPDTPYGH